MTDPIKLAVLGGSGVATPLLIRSLAEEAERPPVDVVLIGRTVEKLEKVAALSARIAARAEMPLAVTYDTVLERGLADCDYILNQIRVGGYKARAYDESFPHAFGLPGEETYGPGGMNNALRTIPVTLEYCRIIEKVAPAALLVNLTNPSSFIQYAVAQYSDVDVVGVCDSPLGLAAGAAALLGAPAEEMWIGYVGMHHFGWITEARWRGRDVMPDLLARLEEIPNLPVDAEMVRAIGALPTSYFKYYYHPDRMLAGQMGKQTRAAELLDLEATILSDLETQDADAMPASVESRGAHWYESIVTPVILAHANDARVRFILNVQNGHTVPWLPPQAIVEVPVMVSRNGFRPLQPPAAPPDIQAMTRVNAAFEMLWVEAVVERDYDKALRAMMLNHLVQNLDQARGILQEIWPEQ